MKKEVIVRLHGSFEELVQKDEHGGEFWLARDLQTPMGYAKWENFAGVIGRAIQLIQNGAARGKLTECHRSVSLGSGAVRRIIDYQCDRPALDLLGLMTTSFKLNGYFFARNESVLLGLLAKWASAKGYVVEAQFALDRFKFDLMVGSIVLIEFDEPHHESSRQLSVDRAKTAVAKQAGFQLLRMDLSSDIVDVILLLEPLLERAAAEARLHAELVVKSAQLRAKAKNFANEITNFNIKKDGLRSEPAITTEHVKNNKDVRGLLMQRGIQPENLPASEDIKKIERRVQSETKKLPAAKKTPTAKKKPKPLA